MRENHWMFFLYSTKNTFICQHQLDGSTNPLIYRHQPKGSSNSLYLQAPTWRKLQLPFPCHVLPPWKDLMNKYFLDLPLSHTCTITIHLIIVFALPLHCLYCIVPILLRSASTLQHIRKGVWGSRAETRLMVEIKPFDLDRQSDITQNG